MKYYRIIFENIETISKLKFINVSTAPYLHNFPAVEYVSAENVFWCYLGQICLYLVQLKHRVNYNGTFWDEFSEHQSSKKAPYSRLKLNFYGTNKVYIQCSMHILVGISFILLSCFRIASYEISKKITNELQNRTF